MTGPVLVTLAERPDLGPAVADWLWDAFWRHEGATRVELDRLVASAAGSWGVPQTLVLLDGDEPPGTASLAAADLDLRPDLTPWLAGVFVVPAARGRGGATRLVAGVEAAARALPVGRLWLDTGTAEPLYARLGWVAVERFDRHGRPNVLMARALEGA